MTKFRYSSLSLLLITCVSMPWVALMAAPNETGMLDNALSSTAAQNNLNNQLSTLGTAPAAQAQAATPPAQSAPPAASTNLPVITEEVTSINTVPQNLLAPPPPPPAITPPIGLEPPPVVPNTAVADQAFSNMARTLMPLTPDQIRMLHYLFDQSRKSAAEAPQLPPKPTSSSVVVNLSPGATPPIIRLAAGFVTSLVFLDSTGGAWPIRAYDLGDPKGFNIQWNKKGNTLLVQASDSYKSGNLAVMLKDLNTPVMITLLPGQQAVDYRVDLRVPGLGPNAMVLVDDTPGQGDPQLLSVLDGIPPPNSKPLEVLGGESQGWLAANGHMYLRTRLTVLSPGWISLMTSADGMHAYELQKSPIVLASDRGKVVQLSIQGL